MEMECGAEFMWRQDKDGDSEILQYMASGGCNQNPVNEQIKLNKTDAANGADCVASGDAAYNGGYGRDPSTSSG